MAEILPFKRPKPSQRHHNRILCRSGFHKWEVVPNQHFDVKQGKLVTVYRCRRCGARRNEAR